MSDAAMTMITVMTTGRGCYHCNHCSRCIRCPGWRRGNRIAVAFSLLVALEVRASATSGGKGRGPWHEAPVGCGRTLIAQAPLSKAQESSPSFSAVPGLGSSSSCVSASSTECSVPLSAWPGPM